MSSIISRLERLAPNFFSLLFCCIAFSVNGQQLGWERYFETVGINEVSQIIPAADDGYIFTGSLRDNEEIVIYRLNGQGEVVWENSDFGAAQADQRGFGILESSNGDVVVSGFCQACGIGGKDASIIRVNSFGEKIWEKYYGTADDDELFSGIELGNGNLVFTGYADDPGTNEERLYLIMIDLDGNIIWEKFVSNELNLRGTSVITHNNQLIVAGTTKLASDITQAYLTAFNMNGDQLWGFDLGDENIDTEIFDVILSNNTAGIPDGFVLAGASRPLGADKDFFMIKTDLDGNENSFWSNSYAGVGLDEGRSVVQDPADGGYIMAGRTTTLPTIGLPSLIKTDFNGDFQWQENLSNPNGTLILGTLTTVALTEYNQVITGGYRSLPNDAINGSFYVALTGTDGLGNNNIIRGNVFVDSGNCAFDMGEFPLNDWKVALKSNTQSTIYTTTDENGDYEIFARPGAYTINLTSPNETWIPCFNNLVANITTPYNTINIDFPVQEKENCSHPTVAISNNFLTPCENSIFEIKYSNQGTQAINNAYIELQLASDLTLVSSEITAIDLGNNLFRFNLGSLPIFDTDQFNAEIFVDCAALDSKAHLVQAEIFPQEVCIDPIGWDGASIEITAECDLANDVVIFTNKNVGSGATTDILESIIIEDFVLGRVIDLDLDGGSQDTVQMPANGSTYRMITLQSENHPGDSRPTVSVEGCVQPGQTFSTGFVTQMPEDDYNEYRDISNQENIEISQFPEQHKRGYPKGFGEDQLISPSTDLSYQINFQATGTDSAIRVVIRDTISTFLDPTTIQMSSSSHNFSYEIYDSGILKITFEDINSPADSGAVINGFVKYRISQKPNNPIGALIKSSAAIYFNFQSKILTPVTCHKVGGEELFLNIIEHDYPGVEQVKVYPNPFVDFTTLEILGTINVQNGILNIYDASGRFIFKKKFSGNSVTLERSELPGGALFFQLTDGNSLIATGQFLAK